MGQANVNRENEELANIQIEIMTPDEPIAVPSMTPEEAIKHLSYPHQYAGEKASEWSERMYLANAMHKRIKSELAQQQARIAHGDSLRLEADQKIAVESAVKAENERT
jgi:hypothetical protein